MRKALTAVGGYVAALMVMFLIFLVLNVIFLTNEWLQLIFKGIGIVGVFNFVRRYFPRSKLPAYLITGILVYLFVFKYTLLGLNIWFFLWIAGYMSTIWWFLINIFIITRH